MARNLQPVSSDLPPLRTSETVNQLVKEYNRPDRFAPIFGTDTGSGTAYVISPVPGVKVYDPGQIFFFKATNANTGTAPTLNVNGLGAGTITYMDGSALVAGDIAANEWIEVVVTSTTPTFALNTIRPGLFRPQNLLQMVSFETGAVATGTTQIPTDDTIPQNNEGDQYLSLSITPKSSTSRLIIDSIAHLSSSASGGTFTAALFQDSGANALAAASNVIAVAGSLIPVIVQHEMTSGTTSATTFKIRAGFNIASTTTFNGVASTRRYGGVCASSIVIREYL